jgi:hypothetical protein
LACAQSCLSSTKCLFAVGILLFLPCLDIGQIGLAIGIKQINPALRTGLICLNFLSGLHGRQRHRHD